MVDYSLLIIEDIDLMLVSSCWYGNERDFLLWWGKMREIYSNFERNPCPFPLSLPFLSNNSNSNSNMDIYNYNYLSWMTVNDWYVKW